MRTKAEIQEEIQSLQDVAADSEGLSADDLKSIEEGIEDLKSELAAVEAAGSAPSPGKPQPSPKVPKPKKAKAKRLVPKRTMARSAAAPSTKVDPPVPTTAQLSWKRKAELPGLKRVKLPEFMAYVAQDTTEVTLPTVAEAGDTILLDAVTKHPMLIIKKQYANKILEAIEGQKPAEKDDEPQKPGKGLGQNPIKKNVQRQKPKVASAAGEKPTNATCDVDYLKSLEDGSPLENWLEGMVSSWNAGETDEKVLVVYWSKREKTALCKVKVYEKSNFFNNHLEYYKICLESGHITKVTSAIAEGKYGDRKVVANDNKVKEYYSSANNFTSCRNWISQAYKAAHEEGDSTRAKELYKKYYANHCINKRLTETQKKHLLHVHAVSRKRYAENRKGKSYYEHFKEVIKSTLSELGD